jgi:hypothetical protein
MFKMADFEELIRNYLNNDRHEKIVFTIIGRLAVH